MAVSARLRIGSALDDLEYVANANAPCAKGSPVGLGERCPGARAEAAIAKPRNTKLHSVLLGAALLRSNLVYQVDRIDLDQSISQCATLTDRSQIIGNRGR